MSDQQLDFSGLHVGPVLALDVSATKPRDGRISGYGVTFTPSPNRANLIIDPHALDATIREHRERGTMPAMLLGHQSDRVVGRWSEMSVDSYGLRLAGQINLKSRWGSEVFEQIEARDITGLSIGFQTRDVRHNRDAVKSATVLEIDLHEVSLVPVGADPRAQLLSASSVATQRDFNRMLRGVGFSKTMATQLAAGGWPAVDARRSPLSDQAARAKALAARVRAATAAMKEHSR
ncbi:HK97 family phage prohead protease [Hansschlegelia zhihuaiae]|uniref:HK97 family phage prohead protease n=1 Tax=Hansschlegelia zhihuaiae TaxID=405005 RepID=A0A4Q0MAI0_9HYPH|nr:HK97 family phage prohead protease [Hansschlegelia zhihuaiae]RXF70268.1 HK97 family phage prohead protease [Hansschlegelia zhihuaiae]